MGLTARQIADGQARLIAGQIGRWLEKGQPYALLDFPDHPNVGDSAIWLGEVALLRSITGRDPSYVCAWNSYDKTDLRQVIGEGVICLHGGGNFGDIYAWYQKFREQVLQDFPGHRIIQLPQTIMFRDVGNSASAVKALAAHKQFRLLTRDEASLAFARRNFDCEVELSPDSAFALGVLPRKEPPAHQLVMLLRSDDEAAALDRSVFAQVPAGHLTDWLDEPADTRAALRQSSAAVAAITGRWSRFARRKLFYDRLARNRLDRGLAILESGHTVITDRLHGHILSTLLDIPHVVLDNDYGKISSYVKVWTNRYERLGVAATAQEAVTRAQAL